MYPGPDTFGKTPDGKLTIDGEVYLTFKQWFNAVCPVFVVACAISIAVGVLAGWFVIPRATAADPPRAVQRPPRIDYYTSPGVRKVEKMVFIHAWHDGDYKPVQYVVAGDWCRRFVHPQDPKGYISVDDWVQADWQHVTKYEQLMAVLKEDNKIRLEEEPSQIRVTDEDY